MSVPAFSAAGLEVLAQLLQLLLRLGERLLHHFLELLGRFRLGRALRLLQVPGGVAVCSAFSNTFSAPFITSSSSFFTSRSISAEIFCFISRATFSKLLLRFLPGLGEEILGLLLRGLRVLERVALQLLKRLPGVTQQLRPGLQRLPG